MATEVLVYFGYMGEGVGERRDSEIAFGELQKDELVVPQGVLDVYGQVQKMELRKDEKASEFAGRVLEVITAKGLTREEVGLLGELSERKRTEVGFRYSVADVQSPESPEPVSEDWELKVRGLLAEKLASAVGSVERGEVDSVVDGVMKKFENYWEKGRMARAARESEIVKDAPDKNRQRVLDEWASSIDRDKSSRLGLFNYLTLLHGEDSEKVGGLNDLFDFVQGRKMAEKVGSGKTPPEIYKEEYKKWLRERDKGSGKEGLFGWRRRR